MSKYCYKCEKDVELIKDPESNAQLCKDCRSIIIHSASKLPSGTIISGFEIVEEIGRGGMGIVYRAKQLNLERHVALKVLADDLSRDEEFVERFFKEARAAASLSHANIVQVYDAGSTPEGIYYFAMELIVGETLETKIERDGCLTAKEALRIAIKISDALDYAWQSQKLTHGDIKPDNIILNSSGGAKLADLGLAKFMHDEKSEAGIMATPLYAPPEIIKGETNKIGSQSDMYSFGATLYQMLTGVPPFADDAPEVVFKRHLNDTPPSILEFNHRFVPQLVQLVEQLLAKEPGDRPFAWLDISKALKKIREPEIEGKIFHTHSTHEEESKDHAAILEQQNPTRQIKPLIFLLVAIVVVLLLAIGGLIISKQKKSDVPSANNVVATSTDDIEKDAKKEFEILKSQLQYLNPQQALDKLEGLVLKYGNDLPKEVDLLLKDLRNKINKFENNAKQQAVEQKIFKDELVSILNELNNIDLLSDKTPIKKIQTLSNRIEKLLNKSSQKIYLKLSANNRATLNNAYMQMSSRLIKYNQEQEKIALQKTAEEKQRLLEEEKKKQAVEENKRLNDLAMNVTIDDYYLALADFSKQKNTSELDAALAKWASDHKSIPASYSMRVNFLRKETIPAEAGFVEFLIKQSDAFEDKTLPMSICPVKYRKYKVKSVEETGIKLIMNEGKVSLGYTLKWNKMSSKVIAALIKERLLIEEEGKPALSPDKNKIVLSYILLRAPDYCQETMTLMPKIKTNDKRMMEFLAQDFIIAEKENELILDFRNIKKGFDNDDLHKAAESFASFLIKANGSDFSKRYVQELNRMEKRLISVNPAIAANKLILKIKDPALNNNANRLFNLCMVAFARYKNILGDNAAKITELKNESLAQLVAKSGVEDIKANRIPFYYWSMEKTGTSWAYYDLVKKSGKMDNQPQVLASMCLAAALDNGDWVLAKEIYDSNKALDVTGLAGMKVTRNWAGSFIFARGILDLQFGNGDKRQSALSELTNIAQTDRNPTMKPLNTALAMEFALSTKNVVRVKDLCQNYPYQLGISGKMEARVALLNLLAMMQKESTTPKEFSDKLNEYQKNFGSLSKMKNGDIKWCQQALNLMNGTMNFNHIKSLQNIHCDFPDVSARILLDAMARYYYTQNTRLPADQEKQFMELISNKVRSIFISSDLWRRLAIFKMALSADSPGKMQNTINELLNDYRISTTGFYPHIIMLKNGADFACGLFTAREIESNMIKFLKSSAVMSDNDLKIIDVISSGDPAELTSKLFINNLPDKGYTCGVLAMMVNYRKPTARASVVKILNENISLFSWEERYLIKKLQTWQ